MANANPQKPAPKISATKTPVAKLNEKGHDEKVIDEHYKMVDGTSFSAPIVSSVVAQMLEANPKLTPSEVKRILIRTAKRVPDIAVDRQGWGAVQPKAAVEAALASMR